MKGRIKTVIIDDEPDAVAFISTLIAEYCPALEVSDRAHNVKEGVAAIERVKPDLIFLDVEMPNGTGFDLLTHFPEKDFEIIFVTAFNHYAIKAIKFSAVDYILKPININEFIEAVKMVQKKLENRSGSGSREVEALLENIRETYPTRLVIPTSDGREYLNPKEIIRIEADRSYSWFYLTDKRKILVSRHLKEFQDLLEGRNFFRPHNSHLVNVEYVRKFIRIDGGYVEMADGSKIPVARNRKDLFLAHMSKYSGF